MEREKKLEIYQKIARKNLLAFYWLSAAIVVFSVNRLFINQGWFGLRNGNIFTKILLVVALILFILGILQFFRFVFNGKLRAYRKAVKTGQIDKMKADTRKFIISRNFVLYNSLITLAISCKFIGDIIPQIGKGSFFSVALPLSPNVMALFSIIGNVSYFKQGGPMMKNAISESIVTIVISLISIIKSVFFGPFVLGALLHDIIRIAVFIFNLYCLRILHKNLDYVLGSDIPDFD